MSEVSRRAYARTRGVSEAAIRKHIASGILAPAVLPNGLIDSQRADALLARTLTRPTRNRTPAVLATAKQRRARAVARDLQDEVRNLQRQLIPPRVAEKGANEMFEETNAIIRTWPARIAPSLLARDAHDVQRLLKDGINDLLGELHEYITNQMAEVPAPSRPTEVDLDAMTPVELAAHTEHLRAQLLELARLERKRALVRTEDVLALDMEAASLSKSLMRALPGRCDQFVAAAKDVESIVAILNLEVDGIVAAARLDISPLTKE